MEMRSWQPTRIFPRSVGILMGLTALAGCGGGSNGGDDTSALPDLAIAPPDLMDPGYPTGPYGGNQGDVLPNFVFQGYWSPTKTTGLASAEPFGEVTFDQLRRSGARYAAVGLFEFWWGACLANAKVLASKAPEVVPYGGLLMAVITAGVTPDRQANKANLDQWIARGRLPFTTTLDTAQGMETYFGVGRDNILIVDLKTMTLVDSADAFNSDPVGAIAELEGLLGISPPDAGTAGDGGP